MKLTQGANQFRIVGSFEDGTNIQGMLGWGEDEEGKRKPFRWKVGEEAPRKFAENPKQFFACSYGTTMRSVSRYWSLLRRSYARRL